MNTLTTLPKIAAVALLAVVAATVVGVWLALGFSVHSLVTTVLVVWVLLLQLDRAIEPAGRGRHAKSASPAPHPRRTTP